jgi:hypothetical protein
VTPGISGRSFAADHVVSDRLQDMVETHFEFYERVTDDPSFARSFLDWLFDRLLEGAKAS